MQSDEEKEFLAWIVFVFRDMRESGMMPDI